MNNYPLTEPENSPFTNAFCPTKKIISEGKRQKTTPANIKTID